MPDISSTTFDSNGIQHLLDSSVVDIRFVDVSRMAYAKPSSAFTGYGANGYWWEAGVPNPALQAPWAAEGGGTPGPMRGSLDRFPDRLFVFTTTREVVLIDADNLQVWMRFVKLATPSVGLGALLGDNGTTLYSADFSEGLLVVATSDGLRVADFRRDYVYALEPTGSHRSDPPHGIVERNSDGCAEDDTFATTITDWDCRWISTTVISDQVLAAVGHPNGLTGVVLRAAGVDLPTAAKSSFIKSGGAWSALDDNDGDSTTPWFFDTGHPWIAWKVRVGDTIDIGATQHVITDIQPTYLVVDPEIDVTDSGVSYEIWRSALKVRAVYRGNLYFANGEQLVTLVDDDAWYDAGSIDPYNANNTIELSTHVGHLRDLWVAGDGVYAATDIGVFFADLENFTTLEAFEYRYSAGVFSDLDATYEILAGGIDDCAAVVVDPETGHLLISATNGVSCVITEIDTSINQAFQHFEGSDVPGIVRVLIAYRNPEGPPDVEV